MGVLATTGSSRKDLTATTTNRITVDRRGCARLTARRAHRLRAGRASGGGWHRCQPPPRLVLKPTTATDDHFPRGGSGTDDAAAVPTTTPNADDDYNEDGDDDAYDGDDGDGGDGDDDNRVAEGCTFCAPKHAGIFFCETFFCAFGVVDDNRGPDVDNYLKRRARESVQPVQCVEGSTAVRCCSRGGCYW